MRHILFLLFMAFTLQAIAQYPATGNKMRLGWQTTGDGLVYRGAIGDTATLDPSGINNAWMLLDTANGNLYAYRAKAWRLVSGGGGGGGLTMPFDSVTFNVNETDASLRELKYSEEKGYLQYGGQDSVQIPLLPGIWYVRNDTSVAIPKGTVLRATGTLGVSGRIKVKHMIANGSIDAMYILGIAMQDIAVGADGYAMSQGKIRKINTQAYSEGAVLYADVDTLGGLTQTEPTGSNLKLPIAFVVNSASNGTIAVRVTSGAYMRDLHDAEITSPVSNASLYYNAAQVVWRDTTGAVLTSDTSVFARDFQINGTTNRLAMFTGSNTVGNSIVTQNGRSMYINSTQDNSGYSFSNAFQFNGFGSGAFDQPVLGIIGNVGTTANHRPYLSMYRSAGSTVDDKTLVPYNYHLGSITWQGADSSDFQSRGAEITAITDSITGVNDMPTALFFGTTANGQDQPTERMRITSAGNVGIGTASPGSYLLNLRDSIGFSGNGMYFSSTNGGTANPGGHIIGTKRGSWGTRIDFVARDTAGSLTETVMSIDGEGGSGGNVGINTSSPSRPLHVAGTTAIRIPVGTTAQRPSDGSNGDLRYSTTFNNIEFYDGSRGLWERPLVGTVADNKVAFASGDTLTSNTNFHWDNTNTRLGIGNAAPDSTLTVTGGIRATTGVTAARFTATGSAVPTNGMYLPATNALAFSTNSTERMRILSDGKVGINATPTEQLQVGGTVRATRYIVNTSTTQTFNINNYSPDSSLGQNIFIGTTGLSNVYQGSILDGSFNTSVGVSALNANTTGYGNTAVGRNTLSTNTIGVQNTAIGLSSLTENTIGILNTGVGGGTLARNTTGNSNTAVGASSLSFTTSGGSNTGVGQSTLTNNTTGSNNTAVGLNALDNLTTTSNNTAVGYLAGSYAGSGTTANQTSSNSTYVGYQARAGASGNTAEVVIGSDAVGNGSNTVTIGGSSTTATIFQYGETRLGMAVDSGAYTLQVNGNTKLIGNLARKKPVTIADTTYTVLSDDSWLICNHTAQIKITLPTAANSVGRELMIKYVAGGGATVISNATNVSPIVGGALTNIILPATAGSWVTLVCDGANWIIMQKG